MTAAVVVTKVGKTFRRYHPERPASIQEAVAKGLRRMRSVERFWGLRDVSFSVEPGRAVGIIGANGSGKSTLLRLIGGVGRPDTGDIAVRGRLGALLDLGAGFHPDLTGRENAILAGVVSGLSRRQVLDRLESIVAFAEVEKAFDNPIRTFSSGMQMRLAFAVAVHAEPDVLLIDEVLSVGDVAFQRKCLERIAAFKANGCSILLVSHEGSIVQDFCDEAIWLNGGRLTAQGPAADVVEQYSAHMMAASLPIEVVTVEQEETYPVASLPVSTIRNEAGVEEPLDETRFGSMELEIRTVRVLDGTGKAVREIGSGQPLRLEIDYVAKKRLIGPIFCSRILRNDGVVCYDMYSEFSPLSLAAIEGPGSVSLVVDRIDLNSGSYVIEVGCYAKDWAYAYDYQFSVAVFVVQGRGNKEAVLNSPYRWQLIRGTAVRVVNPGTQPRSS